MTSTSLEKSGNASKPNPYSILTQELLENVVKKDLGTEWRLEEFEIQDFTKKGDNYACLVTSVICKAMLDKQMKQVIYIAKLNPVREITLMDDIMPELYKKEGAFLTQLSKRLNKILQDINYPQVKFPECVYYNTSKENLILLSKDLRSKGFQMFDRRKGMNLDHSRMLVKELAKLHAASVILKKQLEPRRIRDVYPFLSDDWQTIEEGMKKIMGEFMTSAMNNACKMLDHAKGYEKHKRWLENKVCDAHKIYTNFLIKESNLECMNVICHGDCWNNNVLFR